MHVDPRADAEAADGGPLRDERVEQALHLARADEAGRAHAVADVHHRSFAIGDLLGRERGGRSLEHGRHVGRTERRAAAQLNEGGFQLITRRSDRRSGERNEIQIDGRQLDPIVRAETGEEEIESFERLLAKAVHLASRGVDQHQHVMPDGDGRLGRSGRSEAQGEVPLTVSGSKGF